MIGGVLRIGKSGYAEDTSSGDCPNHPGPTCLCGSRTDHSFSESLPEQSLGLISREDSGISAIRLSLTED